MYDFPVNPLGPRMTIVIIYVNNMLRIACVHSFLDSSPGNAFRHPSYLL